MHAHAEKDTNASPKDTLFYYLYILQVRVCSDLTNECQ